MVITHTDKGRLLSYLVPAIKNDIPPLYYSRDHFSGKVSSCLKPSDRCACAGTHSHNVSEKNNMVVSEGSIIKQGVLSLWECQLSPPAQLPEPKPLPILWEQIHGINIGFVYGIYEELNLTNRTGNGYLLESPEGLEMIHSTDPSVTVIGNGSYYGSAEDGTLRVLYQPNTTHLTDFISPTVTAQCIEFFTDTLGLSTDLSPHNQLYLIKELCNLAALAALICLIVPCGELVLQAPCFKSIRSGTISTEGMEPNRKELWYGFGAITIFSLAGFLVSNTIDTNLLLFQVGPQSNAAFFPLNECNIVMVWMLIFAIGNFVWLFLRRGLMMKNSHGSAAALGLKTDGGSLGKTAGASAAVVAVLYNLVWLSKWLFNVDFRFWKVAVKQFNNEKLIYFIQYLPVWFLFLLSVSLLTNCLWNYKSKHPYRDLLLMGVGFACGGLLVWLIQYGKLFLTGTVLWSNMNGVASVALKNWILILAPLMLRAFYRLTGKNWFGPITLSVFFTLVSVSTTTIQNYML